MTSITLTSEQKISVTLEVLEELRENYLRAYELSRKNVVVSPWLLFRPGQSEQEAKLLAAVQAADHLIGVIGQE